MTWEGTSGNCAKIGMTGWSNSLCCAVRRGSNFSRDGLFASFRFTRSRDYRGDSLGFVVLWRLRLRSEADLFSFGAHVSCINSLGLLYLEMGDYSKAESLIQHALQINQKILGPRHLGAASSLYTLALLRLNLKDYTEPRLSFNKL